MITSRNKRIDYWSLFLILLAGVVLALAASPASADKIRFVPQLGLTELEPRKIAIHPKNPDWLLVVNASGRIDLFDIVESAGPRKILELQAAAMDADFHPDGDRIIAVGQDSMLRFWNLQGEKIEDLPFQGHDGPVNSVALNPSGDHIISASGDGTLRLWNLEGEQVGEPFIGHDGSVNSVGLDPSGDRIVSAGDDGTLRLWNLQGEQMGEPFTGHDGWIGSVAFNPSGDRIISAGRDGTLRLWNLEGEQVGEPFIGHDGWVHGVAFNPVGDRIISAGEDGTLRFWSLEGEQIGDPFKGHERLVSSVAFNPVGDRVISAGEDGTLRLWNLEGEQITELFTGHEGPVWSFAFNPNGDRMISSGDDGALRLWSLEGEQIGELFTGHEGPVYGVAFNPSGDRIISAGFDGTLRLWSLEGERITEPFTGHDGAVISAAFNLVGDRIISAGEDGTLRLWNLEGEQIGELFTGHEGPVYGVAFNPSGDRIISAGEDGTLRLLNLEGEQITEPFTGHDGAVISAAFNLVGDRIISTGFDGTLRLWNLEGEQIGEPFTGHDGAVISVAFNPSGDRIISAGEDGTLRLWNLQGEQIGEPFTGHDGSVMSVAFNLIGDRIISSGSDGTIREWEIATPKSEIVALCFSRPIQRIQKDHLAIWCSDRIVILDEHFQHRGEIFLHPRGAIAITAEGIATTNGDLLDQVLAYGEDGTRIKNTNAVPLITEERLRQILFDNYKWDELIKQRINDFYDKAAAFYAWLGWFRLPFLLILLWAFLFLFALAAWLLTPARLARFAMPETGAPEPLPWNTFLDAIITLKWFGTTRRPLKAWLATERGNFEQVFLDKPSVEERKKYAPLGHEAAIQEFLEKTHAGKRGLCWIAGVGGNGKSALAFQLARTGLIRRPKAPLPVLIAEDWDGSLASEVARWLRPEGSTRGPTEAMAQTLGAMGLLCPLIDALSERNIEDAEKTLRHAVQNVEFRHIIITSRNEPSSGWPTDLQRIDPKPLNRDDVPKFIDAYASGDDGTIAARIEPLVAKEPMPNPLFMRFAIEQAAKGELSSISKIGLISDYVEALRIERIDIASNDMFRAASITAFEALRNDGIPREVARLHLRGVLQSQGDHMAFERNNGSLSIETSSLIDMLVQSGLLEASSRPAHRLQFTYDPVAEYLAANWLIERSELKTQLARWQGSNTPLGAAIRELSENHIQSNAVA